MGRTTQSIRMTLVPTTTAELTTLASQANEGHKRFMESAQMTMALATEVGHLLLKAYRLVPAGKWTSWVEDNCDFSYTSAARYQRYAHYEHELGNESTVAAATAALRGLPDVHQRGNPLTHSVELKANVRALLAEGQAAVRIAEQTGIPESTVSTWRLSDQEINARANRNLRRQRAARKALKEKERHEAVMTAAKPSTQELYSRTRLALDVADAAILDYSDDLKAAEFLRKARSYLGSAEARIVKALGVE